MRIKTEMTDKFAGFMTGKGILLIKMVGNITVTSKAGFGLSLISSVALIRFGDSRKLTNDLSLQRTLTSLSTVTA